MKKLLALLGVASAMLVGCASPQSGHDFDMSCADDLKAGVTTKEQVFACLGRPTHTTTNPDGRVLHQWLFLKITPMGSVNKHLGIVFDKNGRYEYTRVRSN